MSVVLSAEGVPAQARGDFWRDLLNDAILPCEVRINSANDLRGEAVAGAVGQVQVLDMVGPGMRAFRDRRLIRQRDPELAGLLFQVQGDAVFEQGGNRAVLRAGDLTFCDSSTPYTWDGQAGGRNWLLMFPRTIMPLRPAQMDRLTGRPISGQEGPGALVASVVREMTRRLDDEDVAGNLRLSTALVDLIAAALAVRAGETQALPPETRRRAGLLQVKAFIRQRLADPRLSVADIAAAHHLSVRSLQRLFAAEGETAGGWARGQRLERCRRDLLDPALRDRPAAAIGARWGFTDATHFGRAFRARYGMPPAEFREMNRLR